MYTLHSWDGKEKSLLPKCFLSRESSPPTLGLWISKINIPKVCLGCLFNKEEFSIPSHPGSDPVHLRKDSQETCILVTKWYKENAIDSEEESSNLSFILALILTQWVIWGLPTDSKHNHGSYYLLSTSHIPGTLNTVSKIFLRAVLLPLVIVPFALKCPFHIE